MLRKKLIEQIHRGFGEIVDNRFWLFESRLEFFGNREHLREGIAQALQPFLPAPSFDQE